MVGHPKGWMRGLLIACVVFVQAVLATSKDGVNTNPHKATIGRFQISIHDDRLNLQEAIANQSSLLVDLYTLFYSALWYWDSYDDPTVPPESEQTGNLTQFAQSNLTRDEYNKYSAVLLNASRENAEWLSSKGMPQADFPHPDYVSSYLDAIANMTTQTWYYIHGAYIGVGANSACAAQIDEVLSNKAEYEKMGSSAATTLMALLPTFLAFGNLYVPRSSEAYTTSALVGLTTAFYTLGLPVQSMSAVKQSNSHTLAVFGIAALAMIGALGKASKDGSAEQEENLQDLQDWSSNKSSDDVKAHFVAIKDLAARWERRWHLWHAPALLVAAAQIIIFALAVYPLFQYLGVPKFIFGCDDSLGYTDWTGLYLGLSAGVNALFRYLSWEASDHERVKVYALSTSAKDCLAEIVSNSETGETTATHLPPLLPPYVLAIRDLASRIFRKAPSPTAHNANLKPNGKHPSIFSRVIAYTRPRVAYIFSGRNFVDVIKAGFIGRTMSARRWRPVYLLIHLSTEGRSPLITLFTGFMEAGLLLVLTFFFAAQWGGNLVITMIALVLLLVFITLGRALGLVYVWLSSQVWGLTVINCDNVDEIRGVLRIVCSMEGVLVVVNGATYFGGYRMDGRDGFNAFVDRYERGEFDDLPEGKLDQGGDMGSLDQGSTKAVGSTEKSSVDTPQQV